MILGRHKRAAAVMAGVLLASCAVWAAPAAEAATCVAVPGSTIGTDLSIAGQKARVPAISGITVCAGAATAPLVSVSTSGGACTFACLSVLVGGGAVDAEGVTVSYREDGVLKSVPVNPPPASGPASTCVLSVGSPDAPYPDCFIAIGPELGDPIGGVQPVVDDAVARALDAYEDVRTTVDNLDETACNRIPGAYDEWGNYYRFCSDPAGWLVAVGRAGAGPACNAVPRTYDDNGTYYDFCSDPLGWTGAAVQTVCRTACTDELLSVVVGAACTQLRRRDIGFPALCG